VSRPIQLILSCEHGGNEVPEEYRAVFASPLARQHLNSHRGWDPGALEAAQWFAHQLNSPLYFSRTTRLLVDLNRSIGNHQLFSRFTSSLGSEMQQSILDRYYLPYRSEVQDGIVSAIDRGFRVIHLSMHSFTPVFHGVRRSVEIGLLFDPSREMENSICIEWQQRLRARETKMRVELNQPYLGTDDGFTTSLRRLFKDADYAGIELEINNRLMRRRPQNRLRLLATILESMPESRDRVSGRAVS
jgi:predicted N-formylglutamate amidohydrolase